MKKLLKFIPLLVLPLALSSCSILDMFFKHDEEESGETSTTVYPTSITITGEDQIVVGGSTILTATYAPSNVTKKTITWESSNSNIATVSSSGRVKGIAEGNVTITASMDGKNNTKVTATHEMVVGTPAATGVQLDKSSVTLGYGKTTQLTATVNSIYANQTVNWTTNNPSLISFSKTTTKNTLNSNKQLVADPVTITAASYAGTAVITATSEDGEFTASCQITVKEVVGTTVMIYMCGADLESANGLASMDLNEILSVNGQPSDVNILVQTGGANSWNISSINASKSQRWEIRNKQMVKKSETAKVNMGLQSTLEEFVTWGLQNYPAEKYGLIMWNHGGAMGGCCFDEQYNDSILADEFYNAISNARTAAGISEKLDWITYDACLMAVQDIAEYNSHNFNYMLCSEESEAGYGYDYDAWLPSLYENSSISGADLLPVIGHTFMVEEKAFYQAWNEPFDQTQSVLDLSKMADYKTAFESLASDLNTIIGTNSSKISSLGNLINSAQKYGYDDENGYTFDIFDAKSALNKIKANSTFSSTSSKINAVNSLIDQLVIYEEHGEATSGCGLCIFCPMSGYSYPYDYNSKQTKSNFTNWKVVANKIFDEMYYN